MKNRKEDLLEAVYGIAYESGLENLSIRKICGKAGVTPQVVYYYFADKEALLAEAFSAIYRELDREMSVAYEAADETDRAGFVELSALLWDVFLEYMVARPKKAVFYNRYVNSNYINEAVWLEQKNSLPFFNRVFSSFLRDVRGRVDSESYVVLWSVVLGSAMKLALRAVRTGKPVPPDIKRAVKLFIGSLEDLGGSAKESV